MNNPYLKEFKAKLIRGEFNAELSQISEAVREQKKHMEQQKLRTLDVGQTVWFTSETSPSYLIGLEAEILEINRARAVVKLVNGGVGRFQSDRITVYPHHITPVKPTYAR